MSDVESTKIRSFRDLKVWQRAVDLTELLYKITSRFPKEELYGMTSQIRRAAVSVPSNIAEGFGRYHNREYKQFLHVALGSCAEIITQIIIAIRLEFLPQTTGDAIVQELDEISRMLMGLIVKVRQRA